MSPLSFDVQSGTTSLPMQGRRRPQCEALQLTELNPHAVVDHEGAGQGPVELHSFGTVREACPKCRQAALHLILRQSNVRVAHLLCTGCHSCYDAHYAGGAPALAI